MKLTKKNLLSMKGESGLTDDVIAYVLDNWDNYRDNKVAIFTDVLEHGCQSGVVGHLIYYADTVKYYEDHKDEINEMLYEVMSECGMYNPRELFGDKWDDEDPLCLDTYNKNLLAWMGFEETLRKVGRRFEDVEEYY